MNSEPDKPVAAMQAAASDGLSPQSKKSEPLPILLLVEDDVLLRLAAADQFRAEGFHVVEAANADEALTYLRGYSNVDAVFADVRMPGSLDGIELAMMVNRYYPRAKMFLTSGVTDPLPGLTVGFFKKPYNASLVARAIKLACGIRPKP